MAEKCKEKISVHVLCGSPSAHSNRSSPKSTLFVWMSNGSSTNKKGLFIVQACSIGFQLSSIVVVRQAITAGLSTSATTVESMLSLSPLHNKRQGFGNYCEILQAAKTTSCLHNVSYFTPFFPCFLPLRHHRNSINFPFFLTAAK